MWGDITGHVLAFLAGLLTTGGVAWKIYWHMRDLRSRVIKREKEDVRHESEQDDIRRYTNTLIERLEKQIEGAQIRTEARERRILEYETEMESMRRELEAERAESRRLSDANDALIKAMEKRNANPTG